MNPSVQLLLDSLSTAEIDCGARGQFSGRALHARVLALAERLRHTCPQDRPVAVALDHGWENIVADLALLCAELPALPLPPFFTEQQRIHAMREAGAAACLIVDADEADGFDIISLDNSPRKLPVDTAKISFTSGSTGSPKGICLSAEHLIGVAESVVARLGKGHAGRHLALLPPAVLLENIAGLYATLLASGTYVALPQTEIGLSNPFQPDFATMAKIVAEQRITSLILVPEYLSGLVTVMETSGLRLPELTIVAVGGARVPPVLLDRARAVGLPVRQGYGLTECGSVVALEDGDDDVRGSVGRALGHSQIEIAPDGEILLHGPACLGTTDGEGRASGPLVTGDIGWLDDQDRLWIEGRKSNLIITSHGRNISPEWVESELVGEKAIVQAMVHGDGEAHLSALIVSTHTDAEIAEAVAATNARLPAYAHIKSWRRVAPFSPERPTDCKRPVAARRHHPEVSQWRQRYVVFERLEAETIAARTRFAMIPQLQAGLAGNIGRETYIAYLTQAYHHVRHTVPLLRETLARVTDRPELVAALEDYIEEESGHELWILEDISEAGGNAAEAASCAPNPATQAMVDHAYKVVREGNPVGFFGMVYVLEGTSVALATQGAANVAQKLGLPPQAFTYLTSHGALDQEHMKGLAALLNNLDDPADQQAVIDMANAMFDLFGGVFASIPLEADRAAA